MDENKEIFLRMPLVVLHEITVLPMTTVHFNVSKKATIQAMHAAMRAGEEIFIVTSKKEEWKDQKDLYPYGVVGMIKQIMKLSPDRISVRIETNHKGTFSLVEDQTEYPMVDVELNMDQDHSLSAQEQAAYLQVIKHILEDQEKSLDQSNRYLYNKIMEMNNIEEIIYTMCDFLSLDYKQKQIILQQPDRKLMAETFISMMQYELEVGRVRNELASKLREEMSQKQRQAILQEECRMIRKELGDGDDEDEVEEYKKRLDHLHCPDEVRKQLEREIRRFSRTSAASSESAVLRTYIDTLLAYPWGKYSKLCTKLSHAIDVLEADHYGLTKVKERVIDTLAVQMLSDDIKAPIICLVGPPGTGKTSIARSIASATGRKYERICLGGVHDEAELRGHRKTYVGAMPGRIATAMMHADTENPLLLLDEVDKIGKDYKGDASAALLEILDSEQNGHFVDHYFEVPVDLSQVLFIATANDASAIPRPLLDRMELIEINSYTANEKMHIAKEYLITKQIRKNGLTKRQFKIEDDAMETLIARYTREAGVRTLERMIGKLCQKAARKIVLGESKTLRVKASMLKDLLGQEKYPQEMLQLEDKVGSVTGLAWTSVGGDTLEIEVNLLDGKGMLTLTGNLGDVMKESAELAVSYVRGYMDCQRKLKKQMQKEQADIDSLPSVCGRHFFEQHDIHIHVPEGATPKDGPSAGVTMVTALYSAVTKIPVRGDIAMTGEITLRGRVLPIGGLKEKLLAAKQAGKTEVIVPDRNRPAVEEIDHEILDGLTITYANTIEDVWHHALRAENTGSMQL